MTTIISLMIACLIVLLSGCSVEKDDNFKIGVSQCSSDAWRTKMNEEMMREAMLSHDISLEIRSAGDESFIQCDDINYFIKKKVDLLIVAPNEAGEVTPAVNKAYDAGIPVIVVDRNVDDDKYTASVRADNVHIGKLQAQYIMSRLKQGSKIIEIRGLEGSTPARERHQGLIEGLEGSGIEIVASVDGRWRSDIANELADSILRLYPDVAMVAAQNDPMAIGAYDAAQKLYPGNDILFLGVDALSGEGLGVEAIEQGKLDASVLYPTGGETVIQIARKILRGEEYPRNTMLETALIAQNNAQLLSRLSNEIDYQVSVIENLKDEVNLYLERHIIQRRFLNLSISFLVILALLCVALYIVLARLNKLNKTLNSQKQQLEDQKYQLLSLNKELEEATHAKLVFFTNVSHDFRTPLTLIADPIDRLSESEHLDDKERTLLKIAGKNVRVLLRLVNQILDFRKYENGKATLNLSGQNLKDCVGIWMDSFSYLAFKKHIRLSFICDEGEDYRNTIDGSKMERVFFNLMGNAFKFTPENGKIVVSLSKVAENGKDFHKITINNSGEGISPEHIHNIFERFYQIDSTNSEGSGIGLALVKTFVDMMEGTVDVESTVENGTTFIVKLPVVPFEGEATAPVRNISSDKVLSELEDVVREEVESDPSKPSLLVIDDNPDIRALIGTIFCDEYTVFEASNGKQGIVTAMNTVPDIIICDVMMPEMDGLECCSRLKNEVNTSHIPVLMLTACSLDEQRIEGLTCGADAYIAKPFNHRVLAAHVASLMENRKRVRQVFGDVTSIKEENISNTDKDFITKIRKAISERLDDENLSVEALGDLFGMSRVQLYRKVKNITNYTPVEIIRITRLKAARQMLGTTGMTVAEVCYKVGFSSPSYFTKCYKDYFGELPKNRPLRRL